MSSLDKLETLKKAKSFGYRTYPYFMAIEGAIINLLRILHRVNMGGHNVTKDKAVTTNYRSLELLIESN